MTKRGLTIATLTLAAMLCAGCEPNTGIRISVNPITKTMTLRDHTDREILVEKLDAGFGEGKFLKADKISAKQDTTTPAAVAWQGMNDQMKIHLESFKALTGLIQSMLPVWQQVAVNARPTNLGGVMTDPQFQATLQKAVADALKAQQNQPK